MTDRTANYKFELVEFNTKPWHGREHNNWRQLDAILATLTTIVNISGVWDNATVYTVGEKLVDGNLGTLWTCNIDHVSASTGTFATDRGSNPTYWSSFTVDQNLRGTWTASTDYAVNDFVVYENVYAVCSTAHTSSSAFVDDAANWIYLVDATSTVDACEAAQAAAESAASSVNFPASPTALYFVRRNAANDAYEVVSPATVLSAIGAAAAAHNHAGVYEPADATILKDADIGSTVQAYDADTAKLDVSQTWSNTQNFADQTLQRPVIKDYGETINAIGSIGGGSQDIDLTLGNVITGTVDTSETTFTVSNPSASGTACSFTLILTNGGSQTVNWPASFKWPGGTAPSLTASGIDIVVGVTLNGGTSYLCGSSLDIKAP